MDLLSLQILLTVTAGYGAATWVWAQLDVSGGGVGVGLTGAALGAALLACIRLIVRRATTDEGRSTIAFEVLQSQLAHTIERAERAEAEVDRWRARSVAWQAAANTARRDHMTRYGEQPVWWPNELEVDP